MHPRTKQKVANESTLYLKSWIKSWQPQYQRQFLRILRINYFVMLFSLGLKIIYFQPCIDSTLHFVMGLYCWSPLETPFVRMDARVIVYCNFIDMILILSMLKLIKMFKIVVEYALITHFTHGLYWLRIVEFAFWSLQNCEKNAFQVW